MPWGRYARYTAIGAVVWGLVYVGLGSTASIAIRHSAHLLGPTVTTVVVVAVVVALIVRAVRKRRRVAGEPTAVQAPAAAVARGEAPGGR
jgi:membrane-associated protein